MRPCISLVRTETLAQPYSRSWEPPSKSPELGVVSGTPHTCPHPRGMEEPLPLAILGAFPVFGGLGPRLDVSPLPCKNIRNYPELLCLPGWNLFLVYILGKESRPVC